jgi:hypothetical protein
MNASHLFRREEVYRQESREKRCPLKETVSVSPVAVASSDHGWCASYSTAATRFMLPSCISVLSLSPNFKVTHTQIKTCTI